MLRQSFVFLLMLLFVGSWTPSQSTRAQGPCPEGGCKIFLPVVHTPDYSSFLRVNSKALTYHRYDSDGNCRELSASLQVENISDQPIEKIRIRAVLTTDEGVVVEEATIARVIFPGEKASIGIPFQCYAVDTSAISVVGLVPNSNIRRLAIATYDWSWSGFVSCDGTTNVSAEGTVRNDSDEVLTNVQSVLTYGEVRL